MILITGIDFYGQNKVFHIVPLKNGKSCLGHRNRFQWSILTLKKSKILHFFSSFFLCQNFCTKLWFWFFTAWRFLQPFYSRNMSFWVKNRYFWILSIFFWVLYANFDIKKKFAVVRNILKKKKFLKKLRKMSFYKHFKSEKNSCATL